MILCRNGVHIYKSGRQGRIRRIWINDRFV